MGYTIERAVNGYNDKICCFGTKRECMSFLEGVVEVIADGDVNFIRLKDMLMINKEGAQIIYKIRKDE